MENRLYVGNLSEDVSVDALRKRFTECGEVSNVELAADRASGRLRGHAFVTMVTREGVRAAMDRLNGALLDDRPLRVRVAGEEGDRSRPKVVDRVRITMQFRERLNMAYELDCEGAALVIKSFAESSQPEMWRIEASAKRPGSAEQMTGVASAATRALALEAVARQWREQSAATKKFELDWAAITVAMAAVRAI